MKTAMDEEYQTAVEAAKDLLDAGFKTLPEIDQVSTRSHAVELMNLTRRLPRDHGVPYSEITQDNAKMRECLRLCATDIAQAIVKVAETHAAAIARLADILAGKDGNESLALLVRLMETQVYGRSGPAAKTVGGGS